MADITDLVPVDRSEFASELVPCLALTSGVGMSAIDQKTWLNAAFKALDGIPIGLLKRGAAFAMKVADHPSKIVPAIIAEVQSDWDWRRRYRKPVHDAVAEPAGKPAGDPKKIGAAMSALADRLAATAPTVDQLFARREPGGENKA